jgi:STE24 endopeptidase
VLRALRLPAAVAAAIAATELAVRLLRPRPLPSKATPVDERDYFSEAELRRARAYRRGERRIMLASTVVDAAILTRLAKHPPAWFAGAHPAVASAALAAGTTAVGLPLSALSRQRALDVGLGTQSWAGWGQDLAKAQAISLPLSGGAGWLLTTAMRRFGARWWLPGAGGLVAGGVLSLVAGPTLIDPIFNTFEPAEPDVQARIKAIADSAGVRVDRVLVMDASKRTTASNAYVTGLGATKRVVFYDTLLRDFSPAEVDFVVAHEFAHVRHRDVTTGLALIAIASPAMVFAIAELGRVLGAHPDARAVPAVALAAGILSPALGMVTNGFSRAIERRADRFAMAIVPDARTQIDFQRNIAVKNLADPDPPRWLHAVLGTHPTTLERIAMAEEVLASAS